MPINSSVRCNGSRPFWYLFWNFKFCHFTVPYLLEQLVLKSLFHRVIYLTNIVYLPDIFFLPDILTSMTFFTSPTFLTSLTFWPGQLAWFAWNLSVCVSAVVCRQRGALRLSNHHSCRHTTWLAHSRGPVTISQFFSVLLIRFLFDPGIRNRFFRIRDPGSRVPDPKPIFLRT